MDDHKEETNLPSRDDALFETLNRNKKKKRRKTALTVTAILLLLAVGLFAGVTVLRRRVQENFEKLAKAEKYKAWEML